MVVRYSAKKTIPKIYTDVVGLRISGIDVLPISKLPKEEQAWIKATKKNLLKTTTFPEQVSANMLNHFGEKPIRQAYFKIHGRSYFTDFFFPGLGVIVEIDGSSHRFKKDHDRRRDADFRKIGIRTVRVKNRDVMAGRLFDKLAKRIYFG